MSSLTVYFAVADGSGIIAMTGYTGFYDAVSD